MRDTKTSFPTRLLTLTWFFYCRSVWSGRIGIATSFGLPTRHQQHRQHRILTSLIGLRMSTLSQSGRLIARILPKDIVEEYLSRQPKHKIDPESLLQQLGTIVATSKQTITSSQPFATEADSHKGSLILIQASISDNDIIKRFNLQRPWNEPIESTLRRLSINLSPQGPVRMKGKRDRIVNKNRQPPSRRALVFIKEESLEFKGMTSADLWTRLAGEESARIEIPKEHTALDVIHLETIACAPIICSVDTLEHFEGHVYCGVPLVVQAKLFPCSQATISWFVNGELRSVNTASFTPTKDDLDKAVSVLINPEGHSTSDFAEAYEFKRPVEDLPEMPFFNSCRTGWTLPRTDDSLRVMSYNLLADQYTSKEGSKPDRMAYCSSEILQRGRRMPLLIHEILSVQADIVCLQEVDMKLYHNFYYPLMSSQGYNGFFTNKMAETGEGCATFWSSDAFEVADEVEDQKAFALRDLLSQNAMDCDDETWKESFLQVKSLYKSLPRVESLVYTLGQILQVVRLTSRHDKNRHVVVGNTHLYYHPYGDHIRALQTLGVCHKLDELRKEANCPMILMGDFNSNPSAGAIELLSYRTVAPTHPAVWMNLLLHPRKQEDGRRITKEAAEEAVEPPTLRLPLSFPTMISAYSPDEATEFTHHVEGFIGILDYIFYTANDFEVVKTAPLPTISFLPDPLPTEEIPSDHISLVCDLKWKH